MKRGRLPIVTDSNHEVPFYSLNEVGWCPTPGNIFKLVIR